MRGNTWFVVVAGALALGACKRERNPQPMVSGMAVVSDETTTPELGTAQRIRDRLMADPMMSPAAQQMTIVVQGGVVTLRGQVATEQERERVDRLATDAAGNAMVRDSLEVIDAAAASRATMPASAGFGG